MHQRRASVVEMLRDAGAVLLAKLTSGELASGRPVVRRPDQESVEHGARIERIVRRSGIGDRGRMRRVRDRNRDQRIDTQPVGPMRRYRPASDFRPQSAGME